MAEDWRVISVGLVADTAKYESNMARASKTAAKLGTDTSKLGDGATKSSGIWSKAMGGMSATTVALGGAVALTATQVASSLVRMGTAAVSSAIEFDASMKNVQSLGEESAESLAHLTDVVIEMSTEFPQSANILAEGLYDIESSGFSGAAALDVLEASAMSASAGLTETATSARAITAILNSYGLAGEDAAHVSDVLFQTVNVGVVSFEELAGSIGNFVPMAASMGISLEEATGALATMTLAGLPAAEAATSLARVMSAFIKPSAGMEDMLGRLGIGLEDLADPAIGLSGVMAQLIEETGGQTVALQELFPDVRSLRGALALAANEGETYVRVMEAQAGASEGAGAAAEAFKVQMEGLGAQWQLFKNQVSAIALEGLLALFPVLQDGASTFGAIVAEVAQRLSGAWSSLVSAGADVVDILKDLWAGAQPVVEVVGAMFGGAVIGAITVFATALETITGIVARFSGAIEAAGTALATAFVASKIMGAAQALQIFVANLQSIAAFRGTTVPVELLRRVGIEADGSAGMVGKLKTSLGGLAKGGVVALGIYAIANAFQGLKKAADKADEAIREVRDSAAGQGRAGLQNALDAAREGTTKLNGALHSGQSSWGAFGRTIQGSAQLLTPFNDTVAENTENLKANQEEYERLAVQSGKVDGVVRSLARTYELTTEQTWRLVEADKDLNLTTATTEEIAGSVSGAIGRLGDSTGMAAPQVMGLAESLGLTGDALEEFMGDLGKFEDEVAGKLIFDIGSTTDFTPIKLTEDLPSVDEIVAWYESVNTATSSFSADIATLMQQGYDPGIISSFMQAGLDSAGTVSALADNYTAELVETINAADAAMREHAAQQAELARITFRATQFPTDELTQFVSEAAAIAAASWDENFDPKKTAADLGLDTETYNRIVNGYGLLGKDIKTAVEAEKPDATPTIDEAELQTRVQLVRSTLAGFGDDVKPLTGDQILNLASITQQVSVVDETIAQLETERDVLITTHPDDPSIALVDQRLEDLRRVRTAVMLAEARGVHPTEISLAELAMPGGKPRTAKVDTTADTSGAQVTIDGFVASPFWAQVSVGADTSPADQAIANLRARVTGSVMNVLASLHIPGISGGRHGGFHAFATGGVRPLGVGGITRTPIVAFGEPETGGEAFIPRLGITSTRAKKILDVAAAWHGMTVTPVARSTARSGPGAVYIEAPVSVEVNAVGAGPDIGAQVAAAVSAKIPEITRQVARAAGDHKAVTGR